MRRGSALLYVLVALMLVLPVSLALARTVTTDRISRAIADDEALA